MEICNICGEWKYDWRKHECPPIFYFKHDDWGDEFQEIRANHFEDAALRFAQKFNEGGDYCLMNDSVDVIISDGKIEKKFNVSAEPDVHYSVTEIE